MPPSKSSASCEASFTEPSILPHPSAPEESLWGTLTGNPTVLVVDDHAHNARITGLMLSRMGCSPAFAYHGREALQACAFQPFDVILINLNLPVLDGFSTTRLLRETVGPNQHTPVIGMGSHLTPAVQQQGVECGMTGMLEKPVTVSCLLATLRQQLTLS